MILYRNDNGMRFLITLSISEKESNSVKYSTTLIDIKSKIIVMVKQK